MKYIILSLFVAALSSQTGMAQTVNRVRPDISGLITIEKVGYKKIINPLTMQLIDTPNRPMIFYLNALDWAPVKGGSGIPKSMIKDKHCPRKMCDWIWLMRP